MADKDSAPKTPLGISATQVAGSALAAMSAAVFASWAGTAGTLIGAALGSVFATAGAALYTQSIRRSREAMNAAALRARQTVKSRTVTSGPTRHSDEPATRALPVQPGSDADDADDADAAAARTRPAWGRVAGAALAVLVIALGSVTAVEAITGKPVSALFGKDTGQGTTLGHAVGADSKPTPTPTPTPRRTTTATPKSSPGGLPASVKPTERSTTTEPSSEPSATTSSVPSSVPSATAVPTP